MESLSNLTYGLSIALQPVNLFYCAVGVLIGTLVGVLPGIGPNAAISLLPGISLAGHAGGLVGGVLIGLIILRSPVRRNPLPGWALPALAVLLIATISLAGYVIAHGG